MSYKILNWFFKGSPNFNNTWHDKLITFMVFVISILIAIGIKYCAHKEVKSPLQERTYKNQSDARPK